MSNSDLQPLPADPARQADAMLRACEYQILQTVSAWLDLRGDMVLHVEGTEDFDTLSPIAGVATQVKASPQPISLGQKGVQEALNNFWKLRQAAAGRTVKFRYLTIAPFTVEQGKPFGADVAGLALWRRQPMSDVEVGLLSAFLVSQPHLLTEFREWLKRATPEQLRTELVGCVTWEVCADDAEFIERGNCSKLVEFGQSRGAVPASIIKKVARRLVEEVWKTLRNAPPRRLDPLGIHEAWEAETRVSIPHTAHEAMMTVMSAGACTNPDFLPLWKIGTPDLPGPVAMRGALVGRIYTQLTSLRLVNLHGSTRMGKTTLAKLLAANDRESWRWWRAANKKPDEVRNALAVLTGETARSPEISSIVLDDMEFAPAVSQEIEDALGELLALVKGRAGRVIITSQKPLPARLQIIFGLDAAQIIAVPHLEISEIEEFAQALGCDDSALRNTWATVVRVSTAGHPQLTAVRLSALRAKGWPGCSADTLDTGTPEIAAELADIRQLVAELPEPQRELLHRLSVFPSVFDRFHAVEIGAAPPPLLAPGDLFDPLLGPWVEPLHGGYYALSPLLAGCARVSRSVAEFKSLQNTAARVLMFRKEQTPSEIGSAFQLLWEAGNIPALTQFTLNLMEFTGTIWEAIASELWWFTWVATDRGTYLVPKSTHFSLLFRTFQFRIAMACHKSYAPKIVEAWRWELDNGDYPDRGLQRFTFAGYVLPYYEVPMSAKLVVGLLRWVADGEAAYPELPMPTTDIRGELDYLPELTDVVAQLGFLVSARCNNIEFLNDLLTALDEEDTGLRSRILLGFIGGGIEVQMAIDRAWLAQADSDSPDWMRCVSVFERAFKLGQEWRLPALSTAAMRGISTVIDEYVKDHSGAHAALDSMAQQGSVHPYSLHDRRACVFFSQGEFASAETQWRLALDAWPRSLAPFDTGAAFAARSAGISAARQGHWSVAAEWFTEILNRIPSKDEIALMAGANADAGYCWWKAGKKKEAIAALIESWRLADTLPLGRENLRAFVTRKMVGHGIAWLNGQTAHDGAIGLQEPHAGACSSAEMPEKMREQPEIENANVWLFLMRLERTFGLGRRAAELGAGSVQAAINPTTQLMAANEAIFNALGTGAIGELPVKIVALARALRGAAASLPDSCADGARRLDPTIFHKGDLLLGSAVFLAGLVVATEGGHSWPETVAAWRKNLPENCTDTDWEQWFGLVESVNSAAPHELTEILRGKDWATIMLAALRVITSDDVTPDELFYTHARWLGEIRSSVWLKDTGSAFCRVVTVAWVRIIRTPALLRNPRINRPIIESALAHGSPNTAKAAEILLAVAPSVSVRINSQMEQGFRKLAEANTR